MGAVVGGTELGLAVSGFGLLCFFFCLHFRVLGYV